MNLMRRAKTRKKEKDSNLRGLEGINQVTLFNTIHLKQILTLFCFIYGYLFVAYIQ